jgi:hypothetical protein
MGFNCPVKKYFMWKFTEVYFSYKFTYVNVDNIDPWAQKVTLFNFNQVGALGCPNHTLHFFNGDQILEHN